MSTQPIPLPAQLPISGAGSVNPIDEEIKRAHGSLTPEAQQAVSMAIGGQSAAQPSGISPIPTQGTPPPPAQNTGPLSLIPSPAGTSAPHPSIAPIPTQAPAAGPVAPIHSPIPEPPGMAPAKSEVQRLTVGPQAKSGIDQIHSPWARIPLQILNAIGSGVLPGIAMGIPGTSAHHQLLVNQAENAEHQQESQQDEAVKRAQEEAVTGHTEAQTGAIPASTDLAKAQTEEAKARTGAITNPPEKPITNELEAWLKQNPDKPVSQYWAEKSAAGEKDKPITSEIQLWMKEHPSGTSEDLQKFLLAGKPEAKKTPEEQAIEEYRAAHAGSTVQEAREKTKIVAPEHPPQALMITPSGEAIAVRPGTHVEQGSLTPGGTNTEAVSGAKSDAAHKKAVDDAQHESTIAEALAAKPSPTNDLALVMRYIGATKPDSLGKLRLNSNEVNLVYGTRSGLGNLEALASKLQNGQSLTTKQRKDMVDTMKLLSTGGSETGGKTGQSVRLVAPDGTERDVPADQADHYIQLGAKKK